jgi:hypothetical protein
MGYATKVKDSIILPWLVESEYEAMTAQRIGSIAILVFCAVLTGTWVGALGWVIARMFV